MFDVEYIKVNAATFCSILLIIKFNHPIRGKGFDIIQHFFVQNVPLFDILLSKICWSQKWIIQKPTKNAEKLMARNK